MKYTQETFLVVRDQRTGRLASIPASIIPAEIRPDRWFENGYWRYRPDKEVLEPILQRYLKGKALAVYKVRAAARYIVDYACHIAVAAYLFGRGDDTLAFNAECIRKVDVDFWGIEAGDRI